MRRILSIKGVLAGGLLLAALAGAWAGHTPNLSWYCVRGLAYADDRDRDKWIKRVAWLDDAALPALVGCLARDDARACANAEAALAYLARRWGPGDPRTAALAAHLGQQFASLSQPGQSAVLEWHLARLHPAGGKEAVAEAWLQSAGELLVAAGKVHGLQTCARALALADVLLDRARPGPWLTACRELAGTALKAREPADRVAAVHLALHAHFRKDYELLRQVTPLLRDGDPAVRRAALLAVGGVPAVIGEEELLPLLHDADADVRRLCETALRSRGLADGQILLGRLVSDSRPSARLEVLQHLRAAEVEPGAWLRRLSRDPSSAVRAGAVRAAAGADVDLSERLRQMAEADPSPTVRQLAAHYLSAGTSPTAH